MELPIYPDNPILRSSAQFTDLLRWKGVDTSSVWKKADILIAQMEGASSVAEARAALDTPTKEGLIRAHSILFAGQSGAGKLRQSIVAARYHGQDCPEPQFIDRSLDNFFQWMSAESLADIHPIEKSALVFTRIVDIWPFGFGNLTTAIVLANSFLKQAGLAPFFVLPEHQPEFDKIVAQAVTIETQPLVNAIHHGIRREMERLMP